MKASRSGGVRTATDTIKSHNIEEHRHDPYKSRRKLADGTVCRSCMAVFLKGRWRWSDEPLATAHYEICPACQRIEDKYPAGELTLSGTFTMRHGDEIVRLARNTEALERSEHPLQRIMAVERADDRIVITTTDIHLPRRIGHAIARAYHGTLDTHYDEAGHFVRMAWSRND